MTKKKPNAALSRAKQIERTYGVDAAVPLPGRQAPKYPFHRMNVGDSFFVPETDGTSDAARASARLHGIRHGQSYTSRKIVENGVAGVRIWRVS